MPDPISPFDPSLLPHAFPFYASTSKCEAILALIATKIRTSPC